MQNSFEFLKIFAIALYTIAPVLLLLGGIIASLGFRIGHMEGWSRSESLYFCFVTATTVGYGDFRPSRVITRTLAIAIAFTGLVFTGIIVAVGLHALEIAMKS
ncbi:MAG: potassium channel family protein [Verrucomicrobiota bacterium]